MGKQCLDNEGIPPYPAYPIKNEIMFLPKYWTVDSQSTENCFITTNGLHMTVGMINRTYGGLTGLIWWTKDTYDHEGLKYLEHTDLSNTKLHFKIKYSPSMLGFSDPDKPPTLTVTKLDDTAYYIPLNYYTTYVSANKLEAEVHLDFSNVYHTFENTEKLEMTNIKSIMLAVVNPNYQEITTPIPFNIYLEVQIEILEPSTGFSMMRVNDLVIDAHDIRMCTSYDDMYNLSPERVVYNMYALGYRNLVNHYCGMSHYYDFYNYNNQWLLDRVTPVNVCTAIWSKSFIEELHSRGFTAMFSISMELYSVVCPPEWVQQDWFSALAETGYTPPSWLLSPSIPEGMGYLQNVFNRFGQIMYDSGLDPILQVGEPWWWFNTATSLPCIYDYPTKVAFNNETGLYAQDIGTIYEYKSGTPYDQYVAFVRKQLGKQVVDFGIKLKQIYSNAKSTVLVFLPSVLGNLMENINLPTEYYTPANFDFYCTECYDWLIEGRLKDANYAIEYPNKMLGFGYNNIHYLAGFVPDPVLAPLYGFSPIEEYQPYLWRMIMGHIYSNNKNYKGISQYIWAYPQVMSDSLITTGSKQNYFYLNHTPYRVYTKDKEFRG